MVVMKRRSLVLSIKDVATLKKVCVIGLKIQAMILIGQENKAVRTHGKLVLDAITLHVCIGRETTFYYSNLKLKICIFANFDLSKNVAICFSFCNLKVSRRLLG